MRYILMAAALLTALSLGVRSVPKNGVSQAPEDKVSEARTALSTCVHDNLSKFQSNNGLTPSGLAYFVGLTCTQARENYRIALNQAGVANVPALMQEVDARVVGYILNSVYSNGSQSAGLKNGRLADQRDKGKP